MLSVFISGLKRRCGKTIVGAGLSGTMQSLSYSVSYYKPIRTGMDFDSSDLSYINKLDPNIKLASCYEFGSADCPLISSYKSGIKKIDIAQIISTYKSSIQMSECHIVEGANSISTPIDERHKEIDIIKELGLPLILVVNYKQTTLDEIITGVNYIYLNKVKCLGIILNEYDPHNEAIESKYLPNLIKEYTGLNVVGYYPHYDDIYSMQPQIIADTLNDLNIEEIFGLKIAKLTK